MTVKHFKNDLGRFKGMSKILCECGKRFQIRAFKKTILEHGEEKLIDIDFNVCMSCGIEEPIKPRKMHREIWDGGEITL